MNEAAVLLLLLNFAFMGLLPRMFFRRGRLGLMWWTTAFPFFASPALLIGAYVADLQPFTPAAWARPLTLVAVVASVGSIALIFLTLGTHRIPIALFHQENDAPQHIVTYGAYSRIRHPFYAAFILAFSAALALFPHWGTIFLLAYGVVTLNYAATREEQRLCTSAFGEEYTRYVTRTGRFLPRLSTGVSAAPPEA